MLVTVVRSLVDRPADVEVLPVPGEAALTFA